MAADTEMEDMKDLEEVSSSEYDSGLETDDDESRIRVSTCPMPQNLLPTLPHDSTRQ
jgi:hypothetical protein